MRRVVPAGWHCAMTPPMRRALVWLKRDLRIDDHVPLAAAAQAEEALAVLVIEPAWTNSPEFDPQHLAYLLAALAPLRHRLAARGLKLRLLQGALPEAFAELHAHWPFDTLLSHEETGPAWSYTRDRTLRRWCAQQGVHWREWPQTGVQRALRQRSGWAGRWQRFMDAPAPASPASWRPAPIDAGALPGAVASRPLPGVDAQAVLHSFLHERGRHYRRNLGSPLSAECSCSRLSPLLSFGLLSLRQVHQATEARIAALQQAGENGFAHQLRGFAARLRWHCHFMQKLESEPEIEFRHFSRALDGLRPGDDGRPMSPLDEARLQAWMEGRTGFPMVDACMRQLIATGWLNFRMRALLMSFAAYHLGLHWRLPGLHLARQFLDFEPGIHWSQVQMQSGSTGINTLRIYSPRKQALDHDPEGRYQRRWIPELGTPAYLQPIVDERSQLARIKTLLYGLRARPEVREEAAAIQQRHGSRKSGLPPTGRGQRAAPAGPDRQRDLFE